jgi:hypothetical protein
MLIAISRTGVTIRLTEERWTHIIEQHAELADLKMVVLETVSQAERVFAGNNGENLAVRQIEKGKWMVVVYRELETDGFVITAFLTRRARSFERRRLLWS